MREINTIIIHCADTPPTMDIGAAEIDRWHRERGWDGIGYHAVIRRSGTIEAGRPIEKIGAHCQGHNANSIGVCLVGGAKGQADFTDEQWLSLKDYVNQLTHRYPGSVVKGHHDFDKGKTCPNFDVIAWWEQAGQDGSRP